MKFGQGLVAYFLLIRHISHAKRRVQYFFYRYVCISCRGNVITELLLSNDMGTGTHTHTHTLLGEIY
jgi:hypothetical protein